MYSVCTYARRSTIFVTPSVIANMTVSLSLVLSEWVFGDITKMATHEKRLAQNKRGEPGSKEAQVFRLQEAMEERSRMNVRLQYVHLTVYEKKNS